VFFIWWLEVGRLISPADCGAYFLLELFFALKLQKYLLHKICLQQKHHYIFATQKQKNATL
jgi:hypothetical protein